MKELFLKNRAFLIPYFLFLIFCGSILAAFSMEELHLISNKFHAPFFDHFFYYITFLGDGWAVVALFIILLFIKYRYAILVGLAGILSTIITQSLKHFVFEEALRPKKFFEGNEELRLIPWVENYYYNSFPSGHTTAAFTIYFTLALITKNNRIKFFLLVVAILIGYSRVYLSQHFLRDIYAGSLIGVTCGFFIQYFLQRSARFNQFQWLNDSLLKKNNI